jgi:hypothetical protein
MADRKALCLISGDLSEIPSGDRLVLPGDPTTALHAVPKQYSDRLVPHIPDSGHSSFASGGVETNSRFNVAQSAGVSGRLWISFSTAIVNTPITKLALTSYTAAATGTTLARLALFTVAGDDAITKVAQIDSDTTIGAASYTYYERVLSTVDGFPPSYNLLAGTRYGIGYLHVATTPCDFAGANLLSYVQPPVPSRIIDGQTDIATTYAVASIPAHYFAAWLSARP